MDSRQSNRDRFSSTPALRIGLLGGLVIASLAVPDVASAQVRTKKPDRGVYQSPRLSDVRSPSQSEAASQQAESERGEAGIAAMVRNHGPSDESKTQRHELVEVDLDEASGARKRSQTSAEPPEITDEHRSPLQQVDHEDVILVEPRPGQIIGEEAIHHADQGWTNDSVFWSEGDIIHDGTCDGCAACDDGGCDSIGCDSLGRCGTPWYCKWANSSVSLASDQWFGGVELLLMFRKGDRLPPLVTTTVDPVPDAETAGELGHRSDPPPPLRPLTRVLVGSDSALGDPSVSGNGRIFDELRAGGRFTLGTWLDRQQCQSLVMRGWFAGEATFGFSANQDQLPVIARPFLNVSDNQPTEQDTQLIAFPDRADGSIAVRASSDVFGGDLSVRQFWYGKYGGTIDFLYGYQYMRLNEGLEIDSTSTSLNDDFAPLGSILSVADSFDIDNEFHGGQFGVATRYREGCWSFDGLMKFGFGSLRRRATLAGSTFTSIDGANATNPAGLLVRNTNAGTITDNTFGWVPELSASLGWQRYPCFDVTVGYHIVAMTDALQISGAIDPDLAVNLSDPPLTGQQRPAVALQYETYYVQGIHFGLQYIY